MIYTNFFNFFTFMGENFDIGFYNLVIFSGYSFGKVRFRGFIYFKGRG